MRPNDNSKLLVYGEELVDEPPKGRDEEYEMGPPRDSGIDPRVPQFEK